METILVCTFLESRLGQRSYRSIVASLDDLSMVFCLRALLLFDLICVLNLEV